MDSRTQERVEEWDSRPFDGGFDGLSDLAAADFSGAVTAVGTWLFMLNGRIIGVVDGDIEDFETASGTQYQAPHPSLPLLCAMEERGGETRANYYTNETPLREVDNTLQSGSFTGYIELSENVLSGDYYAVYYGGRRMAAAYIGNAERLLTGDEAFERAADEVGIYEVIDVDITVTDVPGTAGGAPGTNTDSGVDSSPDSGSSVGTGPGGSEPAVSGQDAAGTDPTADPTDAAIDPIDVSSTDPAGSDPIEDVTVDDESALTSDIDLTGEHSGITAPDDDGPEPEPTSTGITESESAADPDPALDADPDSITSGEEAEPTDERSTEPADNAADGSVVDDSASAATSSDETGAEADTDTAGSDETTAGTDTELVSGSNPDFEEVKAAAEELERNDISWVDDEDEDDVADEATDDNATSPSDDAAPEGEEGDLEEQFEREEAWRETRRIPSIDPDNSDSSDAANASASGRDERSSQSSPSTASAESVESPPSGATGADSNATGRTASTASSGTQETRSRTQPSQRNAERTQSGEPAAEQSHSQDQKRVAALSEKVETLQEQRDALVAKAEELEAERDRLRSENDELSSTVERLQSRIDELETELDRERARAGDADATGAAASAGTQLSPQQALSGTNLFVRYASKSQPTLETAHDGDADRSEVASNIQLEHHTQFDAADAAVNGTPYEDFLASSMEHRFVDWLTEMLLYEIRDTGNADGLGDLYDAIPRIDRAEIGATISLEDDDTEDVPDQVTFDIVAYDKMGNPLVLVTLNDSREPATEGMLEQLEEAASAVKANYPDLAAAIAVTSSYFEPGALEVAEQATSGGLLSRGSKLSYVNLSRKEGYHLCLVESRSEGFHMNVPEL
ncbi:DUF7527 domain-containing protein [Natrinema salinisoli]|uniref:DUF7527 domain-containing protein n=1 Tax=Natrinema salinisoli TaxID=2878535 RepID=UPI001CF058C3|nr:transcriptional regulator [Natrinema salinisoli]